MSSHPRAHGHRHHSRRGRLQAVLLVLAALVVIALVAGLFWLLSSPQFAKPR